MSTLSSMMKTCKDIEVCHPSQMNGNGNPIIIESGASTGSTYHHLVKTTNDMIVSGNTNFHVNCFTVHTVWSH